LKDFTAANCVVVSPRKAVVASRFDQNSRKAPYYQMVYSPAHDSVVVSSETLLERSWLSLPNGSVMAVYPDGKFELYKP
jgi:predicted glutamine amidotransferase